PMSAELMIDVEDDGTCSYVPLGQTIDRYSRSTDDGAKGIFYLVRDASGAVVCVLAADIVFPTNSKDNP
ncbi:MAG TPA: hypothetical protein VFV92_14535, partial [Candidatus Bathyarchaeia archaeon]|nr:hypothetical protein [Candidatus Bathyarchaeia archaeon]